jgi:pimeloyl-ACP methyl ester carboxylesterase
VGVDGEAGAVDSVTSVLRRLATDDPAGVVYQDEGSGPVVLVVHGGLSDESAWAKVAAELTPSFRMVRIRRRLYRTELPADPATDFASEVDDLLALAAEIGQPSVIVGHSSGAIVALETVVRDPAPFLGCVVYEPPVVVRAPIGGATGVADARAALAKGRPGSALRIFVTRMVGMPAPVGWLMPALVRLNPTIRSFVPRQIDDTDAINLLGNRLAAYASIDLPVLLLTGGKTPRHLRDRTDSLAEVLPAARPVAVLPGQGHAASERAPAEVARLIRDFVRSL